MPVEEAEGESGGAVEDPSPEELERAGAAQRIRVRSAKIEFIAECKLWLGGEVAIMRWATAVLRFLRRAGAYPPPPCIKELLPL